MVLPSDITAVSSTSHQHFMHTVKWCWHKEASVTAISHYVSHTGQLSTNMLWWSITGLCHAIRNHQWLSCLTAPTMLHAHSKCPLKCCCHQISPVAATLHAHSECPLKWCCHQISPVAVMLHAHSECPLKCHEEQLVTAVSHQSDAHSEYPVNQCRHQRSPTAVFHSHYNSKHTVNIQRNLVAIRDHQPVCLTVTNSKHTVIIQWNSVTIRDHQPLSHRPLCLTVAMSPSTQWISSETMLPSEITKHHLTVTMTQAHTEYPVKRCHHQKPFKNHLYTSWKLHVHHECLLKLCCREESLFTTSLVHTVLHTLQVSTEMELPWGITIHHSLVHTVLHTHTHRVSTEMVLPSTVTDHSPSLTTVHFYTQWMVLEMAWHYQSPSSQHQPSTHNHEGSEHLRSVTRQNRINYHTRLANIPFLCTVNTMLVLSSLVHSKPAHPMVSSRMPCTPLRVCAPSSASQSGLAPSMLSATVLVHRKPTHIHTHPVISSRMPCTPLWVCAPSSASQSGLASLMLSANVLVHRKPTDTHTPSGQLKDAVHSPTSVRTIPASQSGLAPSSMLSATVLVHHTPTCTPPPPMSDCTIPCFWIWASTISDVQHN